MDEELELCHFTQWALGIQIVILELLVLLIQQIKLNGVISSSDSFNISVNEEIFFDVFEVFKMENEIEVDKYSEAGGNETNEYLSLGKFIWNNAWSLNEHSL